MCGYINRVVFSACPVVAVYPSQGGAGNRKKYGLLNTSQGERAYNVVDDQIIFIYLFSFCEAVSMKSRPWPHAGS